MKKCLVCFKQINSGDSEYHKKCSKNLFGSATPPNLDYKYSEIQELAKKVISNRLAIPGVQAKLSLGYERVKSHNRLTIVGLWNGIFVLKPPSKDYPQLPENEALIMSLAETCKIEVAPHGLIRFKTGELAYISRRFDRVLKKKKLMKLAQEDMCQLLGHLTEDKYESSMEKVARSIQMNTTNKLYNVLVLFDVTLFSFLVGNADMHLKNFSLLKDVRGTIRLSPAYDLVSTAIADIDDKEDIALTLNGKKNRLTIEDFTKFASYCGIPEKSFENTLKRFKGALPKMEEKINISFLTKKKQKELIDHIKSKAARLRLMY